MQTIDEWRAECRRLGRIMEEKRQAWLQAERGWMEAKREWEGQLVSRYEPDRRRVLTAARIEKNAVRLGDALRAYEASVGESRKATQ